MLSKFSDYLANKASVKPKHLPFCLRWVADCYALLQVPDGTPLNNDQNRLFLAHLAQTHENWQVKQAEGALRLYQYFLSEKLKASGTEAAASKLWQYLCPWGRFLPCANGSSCGVASSSMARLVEKIDPR